MTENLYRRLARLIDEAAPGKEASSEGTDSTEGQLLYELALAAAKGALARGAVEQAEEFLALAGKHVEEGREAELAEQWLLLARKWAKEGAAADAQLRAESALRRAAGLAPERGTPALAQFLQHRVEVAEAINLWREAVRLNPGVSNHYLALARLHEQAGQAEEALSVLMALVEAAPSAKNYLLVAQAIERLEPGLPAPVANQQINIAMVGNATMDHLQSYVKVECYRAGLRPRLYQGGFDQYTQELSNGSSGLYEFVPDVLICAIHPSRLFPQIHHYPFDLTVAQRRDEMEAGIETVRSLLDAFTRRSSALVLLHNMVAPRYPALGTLDLRDDLGQTALFSEINHRLAEMARNDFRNVYIVDEDGVQSRIGKGTATDPRMWLSARLPWSDGVLRGLASEYLRYIRPLKGLSRKCIVLDLDNTLWGGVIGEDGLAGIQVGADAPGNAFRALQIELEKLWRRGILLAISSKNNPDDALAAFNEHPGMVLRLSHFAAVRINWEPKADNIRAIAKELNIGLDSIVFLDDNPVERAKVRAELPQVLTPELPADPAYYRGALLDLNVFDNLALTEEDLRRNKLYAEERSRREFEGSVGSGSLDDYLANLEMVVDIAPLSDLTLPRIAQLTNKTNQFNLTTRRYSEADIARMIQEGCAVFSMNVKDRFGDNGLVGVAILRPKSTDTWEVDTFLMSCRVMGRGVETALLGTLMAYLHQRGMHRLEGLFLPTAKNAPVKDFYMEHGFTLTGEEPDGTELWTYEATEVGLKIPDWLTVRTHGLVL